MITDLLFSALDILFAGLTVVFSFLVILTLVTKALVKLFPEQPTPALEPTSTSNNSNATSQQPSAAQHAAIVAAIHQYRRQHKK